MPVPVVESFATQYNNNLTTHVVDKPSGLEVGDRLVVFISILRDLTFETPIVWPVTGSYQDDASLYGVFWFSKIADLADVAAAQFTFDSVALISGDPLARHSTVTALRISGASADEMFDAYEEAGGAGLIVSPAIETVSDNSLLLRVGFVARHTAVWSALTNGTFVSSINSGSIVFPMALGVATQDVAVAGAQSSETWTVSNVTTQAARQLVFAVPEFVVDPVEYSEPITVGHNCAIIISHSNGTGTVTARGKIQPQISHDGMNWFNDGGAVQFRTTTSAVDRVVYVPPTNGIATPQLRFAYYPPEGSTGHGYTLYTANKTDFTL